MAKYSRYTVGSICKPKDTGKSDYIHLRTDPKSKEMLLKALANSGEDKGLYLNLESKRAQLESLQEARTAGKLKEEHADKALERINKIPDYVRFEIILLTPKNE